MVCESIISYYYCSIKPTQVRKEKGKGEAQLDPFINIILTKDSKVAFESDRRYFLPAASLPYLLIWNVSVEFNRNRPL